MKRTLLTITTGLALCLNASADIVAQWTFNDDPSDGNAATGTYDPAIGSGSASAVGAVSTSNFNAAGNSSDPLGSDPNNSGWRMVGFPAATSDNKTAGAQFAVDTTGYQDITMAWDQVNINSGSKYWRIQYSTDNGGTWIDKDVITQTVASTWVNPIATVSFAGVPEANKNPNFMVRLVSEFQSTATGTGTEGYVGSTMGGLIAGQNIVRLLEGQSLLELPRTTMIGALLYYITHAEPANFQPMKAAMGLLPELETEVRGKRARYGTYTERATADFDAYLAGLTDLVLAAASPGRES